MESDEEELFEEELELISDADVEEIELEEDEDDDDEDEGTTPSQDDAKYVFRHHEKSVFSCHLEPQLGQLAVTGGEDEKAYVWDTLSGNIVLTCNGHEDSVICVEFNRDGTYLATGDMTGFIQVWKLSNKTVVWTTNIGDLVWLKWHHGANVLLAGGESGDVHVCRIPSGEYKLLPGTGSRTESGLIMPDGKRAVIGYQNDSIRVFDIKTASVLHHLPRPRAKSGSISCMDAHPDNNLVIAGSSFDTKVVLVATQTGKVVAHLDSSIPQDEEINYGTESVAFSRDGNLPLAAAGHVKGSVCIWDIAHQVLRCEWTETHGLSKILWDKSKPMLYIGCLDGNVRILDCRNGQVQSVLSGHGKDILDLTLSTDGATLLTASDDKTARVFVVPSTT